jgi:hypothetical protein
MKSRHIQLRTRIGNMNQAMLSWDRWRPAGEFPNQAWKLAAETAAVPGRFMEKFRAKSVAAESPFDTVARWQFI